MEEPYEAPAIRVLEGPEAHKAAELLKGAVTGVVQAEEVESPQPEQ